MPVRVSPIGKIRAEIDALFDGSRELSEIIEEVARFVGFGDSGGSDGGGD